MIKQFSSYSSKWVTIDVRNNLTNKNAHVENKPVKRLEVTVGGDVRCSSPVAAAGWRHHVGEEMQKREYQQHRTL